MYMPRAINLHKDLTISKHFGGIVNLEGKVVIGHSQKGTLALRQAIFAWHTNKHNTGIFLLRFHLSHLWLLEHSNKKYMYS